MIEPDVLNRMSLQKLNEAIAERKELIDQMVGWLYTSILRDELGQLNRRKWEVEVVLKNEGHEV